MFKDKPDEWHTLPVTNKGLMMTPLAKEACDRHMPSNQPPPPEPPAGKVRVKRARKVKGKAQACGAEDCNGDHAPAAPVIAAA